MLDNLKMGKFICEQRRRNHLTQQQLADELGITFQAVSKWENGIVFPNIDGSRIEENDVVLAIASNGLHTNGYSLVRLLMDRCPEIKLERIDGLTFLEQIMKPHLPYYKCLRELFGKDICHGMAHITGGGIEGNLCRIIPDGLCAAVDLSQIGVLPVFRFIKEKGNISDREMLSTFNCGVGMCVVVPPRYAERVQAHIGSYFHCYPIGRVKQGERKVEFCNRLAWA